MALLGLEVTEVPDDDIEDLDLWPFKERAVDELDEPVVPRVGPELGAPGARRRKRYVEAVALVVACAMLWLGVRYADLRMQRAAVEPSLASRDLGTDQKALQACPDCQLPKPSSAPAVAAPPPSPPELSSPTAAAEPSLVVPPLASSGSAPPAVQQTAQRPPPRLPGGARTAQPLATKAITPASPSATRSSATASASPASTDAAPLAVHPMAERRRRARVPKPERASETKPTFRLIAERPRSKFALLPATPPSEASLPPVRSE
jgi:hypothetical protein